MIVVRNTPSWSFKTKANYTVIEQKLSVLCFTSSGHSGRVIKDIELLSYIAKLLSINDWTDGQTGWHKKHRSSIIILYFYLCTMSQFENILSVLLTINTKQNLKYTGILFFMKASLSHYKVNSTCMFRFGVNSTTYLPSRGKQVTCSKNIVFHCQVTVSFALYP